jgi:hypothetical protein
MYNKIVNKVRILYGGNLLFSISGKNYLNILCNFSDISIIISEFFTQRCKCWSNFYDLQLLGMLKIIEDNVLETASFLKRPLVFRILEDGQNPKPRNSECYTPSLEPFRIYLMSYITTTLISINTGIL